MKKIKLITEGRMMYANLIGHDPSVPDGMAFVVEREWKTFFREDDNLARFEIKVYVDEVSDAFCGFGRIVSCFEIDEGLYIHIKLDKDVDIN